MEIKGISKDELKEILKEVIAAALIENQDLIADAVSEAIIDMKLGLAMEEADTGEYVSEETIFNVL